MGAPDLTNWLWPDADQGRAPTTSIKIDRSNPLLAGLADYIIPTDPSSYSVVSGTLGNAYDIVGPSFKGTMRLDGKKNGINTVGGYTILVVFRIPATLPSTIAVAASVDGLSGGTTPWLGFSSNGNVVAVSNSLNDYGPSAVANRLYVALGVYTPSTFTAYVNGAAYGSNTFSVSGSGTLCLMDYAGGGYPYGGNVLAALAWNRQLSPAEALALTASPQAAFSLFQPPKLGIYMPASGSTNAAAAVSTLGAISTSASATQSITSTASSSLSLTDSTSVTQSRTASGSSALGSLASAVTATITAAAIATSSLGSLSSSLTASETRSASASSSLSLASSGIGTQSQAASGSSTLGALSSSVTATNNGTSSAVASSALGALSTSAAATQSSIAAGSSALSLSTSVTASRSQSGTAASTLGALSTSITATEIGSGTAIVVSTLGGLFTSAQAAQSITSSASSTLGGLSSAITANRSLTGTAVSALGSLSSAGSATQSQSGVASSTLPLLTSSSVTQKQVASGVSTLGTLSSYAVVQPPYTATISSTLGGISTAATAVFGAPSYPVNPAFYVKPPYRSFYALAPARPFYAAMLVRTFYVKFNPMLNTLPQFSQKDPREEVVLTWDCTAALNGATITSVGTPAITTQIGQDNPPSLVLTNVIVNSQPVTVNGVAIQGGCAVQAQCTAGSFGSQYLIAILAQTTNAEFSPVLKAVLPMAAQ